MDFKRIAVDTAACMTVLVLADGIYTKKITIPSATVGKIIDVSKDIFNSNVPIETKVNAE